MLSKNAAKRQLIKTFPKVWVRHDGAFMIDALGISWSPEAPVSFGGKHQPDDNGKFLRIGPTMHTNGTAYLTSLELRVLGEYLAAWTP